MLSTKIVQVPASFSFLNKDLWHFSYFKLNVAFLLCNLTFNEKKHTLARNVVRHFQAV